MISLEVAKDLLVKAKAKGVNLYIPTDAIVADNFANDANKKECKIDAIPDGWMGLDIVRETVKKYSEVIAALKNHFMERTDGCF
jgi:phosphoglycerate kinase